MMALFCLVLGYKTLRWSKPTELGFIVGIEVCTLMHTNFEHIKEVGGSQDGMQTVTTASDHSTDV